MKKLIVGLILLTGLVGGFLFVVAQNNAVLRVHGDFFASVNDDGTIHQITAKFDGDYLDLDVPFKIQKTITEFYRQTPHANVDATVYIDKIHNGRDEIIGMEIGDNSVNTSTIPLWIFRIAAPFQTNDLAVLATERGRCSERHTCLYLVQDANKRIFQGSMPVSFPNDQRLYKEMNEILNDPDTRNIVVLAIKKPGRDFFLLALGANDKILYNQSGWDEKAVILATKVLPNTLAP